MAEKSDLSGKIVSVAQKCSNVDMIEAVKVGEGTYGNELLFFIKPEIFMLQEKDAKRSVDLILTKFAEFKVEIAGIYAINGSALEKHNIMAKHYGYINILSNSVSKVIDDQSRQTIAGAYELTKKFDI